MALARIFHKKAHTSWKSLIAWPVCSLHAVKTPLCWLLSSSPPHPLPCPPAGGRTARANGAGGGLAADCGALGLRGMERQRGLTARLAAAVQDQQHPSSLAHPLRDLLAPRRSHIASGEADGQEAQSLR